MGCTKSQPKSLELSSVARELAIETFSDIDENHSNTIDQHETIRWWHDTKFAKLTAKEMFASVDADKNGVIDLQEWLSYWTQVKKSGVSDEEIIEELANIKKRKPWTGFGTCNRLTLSSKD